MNKYNKYTVILSFLAGGFLWGIAGFLSYDLFFGRNGLVEYAQITSELDKINKEIGSDTK